MSLEVSKVPGLGAGVMEAASPELESPPTGRTASAVSLILGAASLGVAACLPLGSALSESSGASLGSAPWRKL